MKLNEELSRLSLQITAESLGHNHIKMYVIYIIFAFKATRNQKKGAQINGTDINIHENTTLIGDDGTETSEAPPLLDFDVRLLRKRLSIIFPIILWPIV